jgi:IS5 family transposase
VEATFRHSVAIHGKEGRSKTVLSDTTIQENNTTFPTDSKLAKAVIDKCGRIARRAAIEPVIGHLKARFRMGQNYYSGESSPKINALLAATA